MMPGALQETQGPMSPWEVPGLPDLSEFSMAHRLILIEEQDGTQTLRRFA